VLTRSRLAAIVAVLPLLAGPTVIAFFDGGFFDEPRLVAAILAWVLVAFTALVAERPLPRRWPGRLTLVALLLITVWAALSLTWAPLAGPALDDVQRLMLYSAFLVTAAAWLRPPLAEGVEPALALGALVVVGYGLSERLLPSLIDLSSSLRADGRLEQPITYWNGMGLVAAFGLVLCTRLAGSAGRPGHMRALAAAAAPALGAGLMLTLSRGAFGALAAGLLLMLALEPEPRQAQAVGVTGVAAGLGAALAAALPSLSAPRGDADPTEGAVMLAVLVLLSLAAAVVQLRLARSLPRGPAPAAYGRRARLGLIALLSVLVAAAVVGAATSSRRSEPKSSAARPTRLASVESPRYRYWDVALHSFADHPVRGVGTAGFRVEWLREGDRGSPARDAHSLYIETAAELGIIGLTLLAALALGLVVSTRRALGRHRAAAVGPAAALFAVAFHAGFDWDWELPAVTLPGLVVAGLLLAAGDERGGDRPDVEPRRRLRAGTSQLDSPPPGLAGHGWVARGDREPGPRLEVRGLLPDNLAQH
jgi:hypothetical protein